MSTNSCFRLSNWLHQDFTMIYVWIDTTFFQTWCRCLRGQLSLEKTDLQTCSSSRPFALCSSSSSCGTLLPSSPSLCFFATDLISCYTQILSLFFHSIPPSCGKSSRNHGRYKLACAPSFSVLIRSPAKPLCTVSTARTSIQSTIISWPTFPTSYWNRSLFFLEI